MAEAWCSGFNRSNLANGPGGSLFFFALECYVSKGHKKENKAQENQINLIPNPLQPQLQWSLPSNVNWFPCACRHVTSPIYSLRMRIWVDFAERWTPSSRKEAWCSPSPKVKALIHPLELKQDNDKTFPLLTEHNCCQNILKWIKVTVKSFHSHVFPIGLVAAIVLILRVQRFCKNILFFTTLENYCYSQLEETPSSSSSLAWLL